MQTKLPLKIRLIELVDRICCTKTQIMLKCAIMSIACACVRRVHNVFIPDKRTPLHLQFHRFNALFRLFVDTFMSN